MPVAPFDRPRRAVVAIYGLAAALLLLGLALGRPDERRRNRIPRPLRMLSSALVLAGALLIWKNSGARSRRAARLAAGGMAWSFLGDLIMARVIPLPKYIIFGMLSFGAGHVLYIQSFLERAAAAHARPYNVLEHQSRIQNDPRRNAKEHEGFYPHSRPFAWLRGFSPGALGLAWALALAGWWALAGNKANTRQAAPLRYGALVYALLLGSMSGLAAALAARDRRHAPRALGGGLFLASDAILAGELFREADFPGIGDVIWLTYIAGQALIVGVPDPDEG